MVKPGEHVEIRRVGTDDMIRGMVTQVNTHVDAIDVSLGTEGPGAYRTFAPGRTSTTITIEIEP